MISDDERCSTYLPSSPPVVVKDEHKPWKRGGNSLRQAAQWRELQARSNATSRLRARCRVR